MFQSKQLRLQLQLRLKLTMLIIVSLSSIVHASIIFSSDANGIRLARVPRVTPATPATRAAAFTFIPRGGARHYHDDNDDNDDEYDDNYDIEPQVPPPRKRPHRHPVSNNSRPPSPSRRGPGGPPPGARRRPPPKRQRQRQCQRRRQTDVITQAKKLGQHTLSLATAATMTTLKTSGKAAYYLTAPKYVSRQQVCGIWRLDQSIGSTACAANIEFNPQGDAITKYEGKESGVNGYLFQARKWPRSCSIEFEAEAFQGPGDDEPVRYYYKGSFRRKIADKNVIKIVGKIYQVKKRFGRRMPGEEVGSFVARRRITAADRNARRNGDGGGGADGDGDGEEGEEGDFDVYDEYDEYDDEDLYDDEYDEFEE